MPALRILLGMACALLLATAGAQDFAPVPTLTARVTDQVGMLTAQQRGALENVLKEYEERTGSQIAVLLVSKTAPEAIEQYSI
ncbi:MAG: TPM domain-containing protein, partial [Bacillota bacterium]